MTDRGMPHAHSATGEPLSAALRRASAHLAAAGVASPDADALTLAAHLLAVPLGEARRLAVLGAPAPAGYAVLVRRRAAREPLQHLTGRAGFRGLELAVGPGVFVPRPETELAVSHVLTELERIRAERHRRPLVVDLGTGSGAIALSVKAEAPYVQVVAVEASAEAVEWTRRNQRALDLDVSIVMGDARTALPDLESRVDVVVTNPPYIPDGATPIDPEVRDHDPHIALFGGGADGLDLPLAFADRAAQLLRPGGLLVMEHADVQGATLPAALRARGWAAVTDHVDLAGRPRHLLARRRAVDKGRGDQSPGAR